MINIVCTSKPVDGLLYYSYEYCSFLNEIGIEAKLVIIPHRNFTKETYIHSISNKYVHCQNISFNTIPDESDTTLVMGRSMITLSWINFKNYDQEQKNALCKLFSNNVIAVYSENHPEQYPLALDFYKPKRIIDICDTEVYPNGVGKHFEKRINFSIYKPYTNSIEFEHLFLGTNDKYYAAAQEVIHQYPDHGILTYNEKYINPDNNNILSPVKNLMGIFNTYVYTKKTFDPAPRIIQECKYFGKNVIYLRDKSIVDGGSVYWKRELKELDITAILDAIEKLKH